MSEGNGVKEPRTIVGNFDITLNLTQTRGIKMSGYVYSDDTAKEINKRIDLFQDTIDRQAIRSDIVNKRAQVEAHTIGLKQVREQYDQLVNKKNNGGRMTSQDNIKIDNCKTTVERATAEIDSLQAAIKAGEERLAAG